jgi:monooxygenase
MLTMGYSFRPWTQPKTISDGDAIRRYIEDTARETGIEGRIRFRHRVVRAEWSSADARWTVEALRRDDAGREETVRFTAGFLCSCAGYYRYEEGYTPEFPGREDFQGTIVHPQHWPEDLDYAGKRIVVIGSGATAITLLPSLAKTAGHVTMLQRSPTWIVSRPERDPIASLLRRSCRLGAAFRVARWLNTAFQQYAYRMARRRPERARRFLLDQVRQHLGRTTTSPPTSPPATTRGSSGSAWCPTRTSSTRSARAAPASRPTPSSVSPRRASGSPRAASCRPT